MSKSLLRREEYTALGHMTIHGRILDVGGSTKSGYHDRIQGDHEIVTANIDAQYGADLIFDAEQEWPIESKSFDAVLFINVLEHLYHYQTAVKEARRILKDGGRVVVMVPFLFNVHGSPGDHFRYTKSTLMRVFSEAGFTHIEVTELGTGAFSVMYHLLLGFIPWKWLGRLLMPVFVGMDKLVAAIKPHSSMSAQHMPLGYMVVAVS